MYNILKLLATYLVLLIQTSICYATASDQPSIVVSIKPFYNLVAAVTKNQSHLKLLVQGNTSPDDYTLKPSDLQMLSRANLIFWGGPNLEPFLVKLMQQNHKNTKIINLSALPGIRLLPIRNAASWKTHQHCTNCAHSGNNFDPHLWLSIHNATIMVNNIALALSGSDPQNALLYQANAREFLQHLQKLDTQLKTKLAKVENNGYLVFHDAYQYFETNYPLHPMGAITLHPEIPASVKHVQEIKQLIQREKIHCLFSEPQFQPQFITILLKDTNIKHLDLDPIGKDADLGEDGYLKLLQDIANNMRSCLDQQQT